jgi:hypothetical protein
MNLIRETAIRNKADEPTIKMLDLWKDLCNQKIGIPIEVMIGNRKEHWQLSSFPGELNASYYHDIEGRKVLVLWLNSLSNVDMRIITHELGHRFLELIGFCGLIYLPQKRNNIEILINSMSQHVPLYELQRSLGQEPQDIIDSRVINDMKIFKRENEVKDYSNHVENALLLADDLINGSKRYCIQLEQIVRQNHPNVFELLSKILELKKYYDLLIPSKNLKFRRKVIQNLKLGSEWKVNDEVKILKSEVEKLISDCD